MGCSTHAEALLMDVSGLRKGRAVEVLDCVVCGPRQSCERVVPWICRGQPLSLPTTLPARAAERMPEHPLRIQAPAKVAEGDVNTR